MKIFKDSLTAFLTLIFRLLAILLLSLVLAHFMWFYFPCFLPLHSTNWAFWLYCWFDQFKMIIYHHWNQFSTYQDFVMKRLIHYIILYLPHWIIKILSIVGIIKCYLNECIWIWTLDQRYALHFVLIFNIVTFEVVINYLCNIILGIATAFNFSLILDWSQNLSLNFNSKITFLSS